MRRLSSSRSEFGSHLDASRDFLEELRESFTGSFAYDLFDWPATPQPSSIGFAPLVVKPAPKDSEADAGPSDDPVSLYTSNADIPVYLTGHVMPIEGEAGIVPETSRSGPLVAVDDFRADARFAGIDGSGYTVAVLDTGIDLDDPFFGPDANGDGISDRIVYQYDFADGDADANDIDGHGSNVSSIAASSHGTYTGMAPGADIAALKVFADSGSGYFSYIEDALQWVITNADAYNIVSVNMSLSDSGNYDTPVGRYGIADELATLASMNVVVVSASGNAFYEFNSIQGVAYPSADPNSLSVGAVYEGSYGSYNYSGPVAYSTGADQITPFSQRDDQLSDIFAPGAPITGAGAGSSLVTMHGTSQAAPHIAGIIALAQQLAEQELGRKLTFDEVAQLLKGTGDTIIDGDDEDDNVTNTGLAFQRVNVLALGEAIIAMAEPAEPETFFSIAAVDATKTEGDDSSTSFGFTVTRSGDASSSASIDYAVAGSGTNPAEAADFAGGNFPSGSITFAAGETSQQIQILVSGDTEFEADEGFTVTLNNPPDGAEIVTASADAGILNDDPPPPATFFEIAAADAVKAEGDTGTTAFTFTVTRSGDTSAPGSVDWAVSNTDVSGDDFPGGLLPGGTVSFAAGEASKTITVEVAGDLDIEADETFTVVLSNPSTGGAITTASAQGTILNDDAPPSGPVVVIDETFDSDSGSFTYSDTAFDGGADQPFADGAWNSGALRIDLGGIDNSTVRDISGGWTTSFTLGSESDVSLSFLYELAQSARYEKDEYSQLLFSVDGGPATVIDTLTGDGNKGDAQSTGQQTFVTALGTLAAGEHSLTIGGYNNKKTWSNEFTDIMIDDVTATATPILPPPPVDASYAIAASAATLDEGDDGTTVFTFTVTRSGDLIEDGSVDWSVGGTGGDPADGDDFLGGLLPSGTVTFDTAGESEATIVIEVAGDSDFEADESFTVVLSNPAVGGEIAVASAEGSILNDDAEPAVPVVLVEADFNGSGDTAGFVYSDGVFGGADPQADADGSWSNGALSIALGGGDNTRVDDMSGAWQVDFTLAEDMDVSLSFSYELLISSRYESDEFSQVLLSLDGGAPITVDELFGNGNGGSDDTTGLQDFALDLGPLEAGTHSLSIGGYNNKKTWSNETTEITVDDVLVTGSLPAGGAGADPNPLGLLAGGGAEAQPLGVSETELLANAGI